MKFETMHGSRFHTGLVALALCGVLAPSAPALAQHGRGGAWASRGGAHAGHTPGRWHGGGHRSHPTWVWSGGFWYLGPGLLYAYPWPYPYATAYRVPATPLVVLPESAAPSPPPVPSWYYCEAARAYYPAVATCPGGWKAVPAVPADASPVSP